MTYLLASGLIAALALVGTLSILLYKAQRETMAVRDLYENLDEMADKFEAERDEKSKALDVTSAELSETKQRLVSAESQRDDAWRLAREEIAKHIMESDLAGAADIGNAILRTPLPGVRLSDTADGALEKP